MILNFISTMQNLDFSWLPISVEDIFSSITIQYVGIAFTMFVLWYILIKPLNRVRTLTEVGWSFLLRDKLRNRTLAEAVSQVQRMRKVGNLPPVFPNGWFALTDSRSLKKKEVKSINALGETFAVFRTEEGTVKILDAYCPHMGANMAVGGVVKGDCLECPFHGWQFDGKDGKCSTIPYSEKVPEAAKVRKWECREVNGIVFVWYHAEDLPPTYDVPAEEDIANGSWSYRGRTEHEVLAHIQELPENGADLPHLSHLHEPIILKGADLVKTFKKNKLMDFMYHSWGGEWAAQEAPNEHIAHMEVYHSWGFFGGLFNLFPTHVAVRQIGPSLVHLYFDTMLGKAVLIQTVTPLEPLRQRLTHQFYTSSLFLAPIAKAVLLGETYQVERDIMVWNNKQYLAQPFLVKEDKLIKKFRKWYSQFYSENSPKLTSFQKDTLDW